MKLVKELFLILVGSLLVSLGVALVKLGHLIVSGTIGVSILLNYVTSLPLDVLIFWTSVPFYLLSLAYMGKMFTLKTFVSVCMVSLSSKLWFSHLTVQTYPLIHAIVGGACLGLGILLLLKARSSVGGFTIVAVFFHKKYQWKTKNSLLSFDVLVVVCSLFICDIQAILYSLVSMVVVSLILDEKIQHNIYGLWKRKYLWTRKISYMK